MQHQYPVKQIAHVLDFEETLPFADDQIQWLLTDSRRIISAENSIFFALVAKQDGHRFIEDLVAKGLRSFVVSDRSIFEKYKQQCNVILVPDTLKALQKLAAYHRSHFDFPVIGITGSNGKTVVKDWLYQLCSPEFRIVRSPKSYNSQIGVALSVWNMNHSYQMGIFEAGISTINEMDQLASMIQPSIGVLTNIKAAHDDGFIDRSEKTREKLKLFKNATCLIYHKDSLPEDIVIEQASFSWSMRSAADLRVLQINVEKTMSKMRLLYEGNEFEFESHFTDEASIENLLTCISIMLYLQYDFDTIERRSKLLHAVAMRLELKKGIQQSTIVNDSYSADLSSLFIAVDFLLSQKHQKTTVILSDIARSSNESVYPELSKFLADKKIDRLIGIGTEITNHSKLFPPSSLFFKSTDDFLAAWKEFDFREEGILVKGARHFQFEKIVTQLEEKLHDTVLEINLNSLVHNLNYYRSKLHASTKIMAMVKAFAYGSGSTEIASVLQFNKVDYLAVAYADEGISLRKEGIDLPIMVMSPESASFEKIIEYRLEPELHHSNIFKQFALQVRNKGLQKYPIHVKLDTGMHRLGFGLNDMEPLLGLLQEFQEEIQVQTIFSHFAAADDAQHDEFSNTQIARFDAMFAKLQGSLPSDVIRHMANSAATLRFPEAHYEMVRLGIGLYGIETVKEAKLELQRVATLKSRISQINRLSKGDTVGYSRAGVLERDSEIATIKIGYADGFSRKLGNGNYAVMVRNQACKIIGSVCMDMCMIDVTGLGVMEGEEVVIFGDAPSIEEMAVSAGTIPYEILTSISQRVNRVYHYE